MFRPSRGCSRRPITTIPPKESSHMASEPQTTQQTKRTKRPMSRLRRLLLVALATTTLLVCLLAFLNRQLLLGVFFSSHFVGGDPNVATLHLPSGFSASV